MFSYAGMPYEDAERNLRLFATEVMPQLQRFDTRAPVAPRYAVAPPSTG